MALHEIKGGLRALHNGGNSVAKVSLAIPAGDELAVSEYVADQLQRQGAFYDGAPGEKPAPAVAAETEAVAKPVAKKAAPKKAVAKKAAPKSKK